MSRWMSFLVSYRAFGLRYPLAEVPVVGPKAAGVKAMNLKEDDQIVNGLLVYSEGDTPVIMVTQRGRSKTNAGSRKSVS